MVAGSVNETKKKPEDHLKREKSSTRLTSAWEAELQFQLPFPIGKFGTC